MLKCLTEEITLRHEYLKGQNINTIYFGGGTPSLIEPSELEVLFDTIVEKYNVVPDVEITMEANPEDLTLKRLKNFKALGINRLSIGIQSFHDYDLVQMNRNHTATQSLKAIDNALKACFDNITVDLIFGLPHSTLQSWEENLQITTDYNIPHISCYNLTVEERTALFHFVNKKNLTLPSEDKQKAQFIFTQEYLGSRAYSQYELSNYSKSGRESEHNRNYWNRVRYLGIGPSAHSFKDRTRSWNVAHNIKYMKAIENGSPLMEQEHLTDVDVFNELIMLGLRQKKGVSRKELESLPGRHRTIFYKSLDELVKSGHISEDANRIHLKPDNLYLSDYIASQLFLTH